MNLDTLLVYLARGALTAFEVITAELSLYELKSLRHVSHEVSMILVPYVFHASEEICVSAYRPDLDIAQAVLANPLLRCRVQRLFWDYSVIDLELLRYSWYDGQGRKVCGQEWQGFCDFVHDHSLILAYGLDIKVLEDAFQCLPRLTSMHVVHANIYGSKGPTTITLARQRVPRSSTTIMFGPSRYSIRLLESVVSPSVSPSECELNCQNSQQHQAVPGHFQNLVYTEGFVPHGLPCWSVKVSSDRIIGLLAAMALSPHLSLHELVVSPNIWSMVQKVEAWARALEQCPSETLAAWSSKFASIERLQLFIDDGVHVQADTVERHCLQKRFTPALQAAANLQEMQISGTGWDVFAMLSRQGTTPYPRLRRLFIEAAQVELESLTRFRQQHMMNLQVLDIRHSHLRGGSWHRFLLDLVGVLTFPAEHAATQSSTVAEDRDLDITLFVVSEEEDTRTCYATHCIFTKSISRTDETLELSSEHKSGQVYLTPLSPASPAPLRCRDELFCKIYSGYRPHTFDSVLASRWSS